MKKYKGRFNRYISSMSGIGGNILKINDMLIQNRGVFEMTRIQFVFFGTICVL